MSRLKRGNSLTEKRDGSIIPANPHPCNKCYFFQLVWTQHNGLKRLVVAAEASEIFRCRKPVVVPPSRGSGSPAKCFELSGAQCILCLQACFVDQTACSHYCVVRDLGEKDSPVCWLAVGDGRCFSLDRSAAASILCNLSVFVSG